MLKLILIISYLVYLYGFIDLNISKEAKELSKLKYDYIKLIEKR